jgi:hypothetical protein
MGNSIGILTYVWPTTNKILDNIPPNADKIFVMIANQYLPVVSVNMTGKPVNKKPIMSKSPSRKEALKCFTNDELIITSLENGIKLLHAFYTEHNTTEDFIEKNVFIFASPVLFELKNYINLDRLLKYDDISDYINTQNIPLYSLPYNKKQTYAPLRKTYDKLFIDGKCKFTKSTINSSEITNVYCFDGFGRLNIL